MSDKVVFLAYSNSAAHAETTVEMLSCRQCRNKTFRLQCAPNCGAAVCCAACGQYIGKMGWLPDGPSGEPSPGSAA